MEEYKDVVAGLMKTYRNMYIRFVIVTVMVCLATILIVFGMVHTTPVDTYTGAALTAVNVDTAKTLLQKPKCNLQFNKATREYFIEECGFTDEEIEILKLRGRGFSLVQISEKMGYSESTVQARIRSIKKKMLAV